MKQVLIILLALAACETPTEYNDIVVTADYDPELVRRAAKNGALLTEVVGAPTEFTGARSIADAMELPPYFHGILLAGEPPNGPGMEATRLVLAFDSSKRSTPEKLCSDAASIRPRRSPDLDLLAVLCAGAKPISYGRVKGGSYSSMTLKEFRELSAVFLGRLMPYSRI